MYLVLSAAGIKANQCGLDHDGIERIFAVNYPGSILRGQPAMGDDWNILMLIHSNRRRSSNCKREFGDDENKY
ncbi:hypothetical protein BM221_007350 [Beauveria bassiana]|uniref:Uncharacterized protein n=1 Tax=Beauveria bassiana TaxID=176275 RepID=A0A2N6NGF3_BEABA|nr:hypothetical protein BM221_007350 [Beauveria bassiana]